MFRKTTLAAAAVATTLAAATATLPVSSANAAPPVVNFSIGFNTPGGYVQFGTGHFGEGRRCGRSEYSWLWHGPGGPSLGHSGRIVLVGVGRPPDYPVDRFLRRGVSEHVGPGHLTRSGRRVGVVSRAAGHRGRRIVRVGLRRYGAIRYRGEASAGLSPGLGL